MILMNFWCACLFLLAFGYTDAVIIPVTKMGILIVKGEILYSYKNNSNVRRVLDASMGSASELWNSYDPVSGKLLQTMKIKSGKRMIIRAQNGICTERPPTLLDYIDELLFSVLGLSEDIDISTLSLEAQRRVVRGISCDVYSCVSCLTGERIPANGTVKWAVNGYTEKTIREVSIVFPNTINDEYPHAMTVSVALLSNVAGLEDIRLSPTGCTEAILHPFEENDPFGRQFSSTEQNDEFPKLPLNFRALVETTTRGGPSSFLIEEEFSSSTNAVRVRFIDRYLDVAGRSVRSTFVIDGNSQTSYHRIDREIPSGQLPLIEQGVRRYFWPADKTCTKTVFGFNIMVGSTEKLLLVPDTLPIIRMGKARVRGFETDYWQINTDKLVVRWFFAQKEPGMTYRPIVRMIVDGKESAPHLFPSHPFYQRGEPFPSEYADSECKAVYPIDTACWTEESSYHYMYDFYGFGVGQKLYEKSDVSYDCRHAESINSYPRSPSCQDKSNDGAMILLFICGSGFGALVMYMRMKSR